MDSWQNSMIDANERGTTFDDFFQEWVLHNTASTSQLEPPKEYIGAPVSNSVGAVHHGASSSNLLEPLNQNCFINTPNSTLYSELTFHPEPSFLPAPFEDDNRSLDKRSMSGTETQFEFPVMEVHHEASTSNTVELIDKIPDYGEVFEWLVEDSWDFICNYDRKARKCLSRIKFSEASTSENPQNVKPKRPYKFHKLNTTLVVFGKEMDISWLPAPVCSCTGTPRECHWSGAGGWSSVCCTSTLSMYPLPPNRRNRGRRMGLSTYTRLIEEMYANGHNFCNPIDLKDHWAKHGTNKFVVVR